MITYMGHDPELLSTSLEENILLEEAHKIQDKTEKNKKLQNKNMDSQNIENMDLKSTDPENMNAENTNPENMNPENIDSAETGGILTLEQCLEETCLTSEIQDMPDGLQTIQKVSRDRTVLSISHRLAEHLDHTRLIEIGGGRY